MAPPNAEKPVGRDDEDGIVQEEKYGGGGIASLLAVEDGGVYNPEVESRPGYLQTLLDAAVEENRIKPVPVERRITLYGSLCAVVFISLRCILPSISLIPSLQSLFDLRTYTQTHHRYVSDNGVWLATSIRRSSRSSWYAGKWTSRPSANPFGTLVEVALRYSCPRGIIGFYGS